MKVLRVRIFSVTGWAFSLQPTVHYMLYLSLILTTMLIISMSQFGKRYSEKLNFSGSDFYFAMIYYLFTNYFCHLGLEYILHNHIYHYKMKCDTFLLIKKKETPNNIISNDHLVFQYFRIKLRSLEIIGSYSTVWHKFVHHHLFTWQLLFLCILKYND